MHEIATVNLECAAGLPVGTFDAGKCLRVLDEWTRMVEGYTRRSRQAFRENPAAYDYSETFFLFLSMATMLKHPRGLGIQYQPTAIGNFMFKDARDDFLHGLVMRRLGTCASIPVLMVAIGRRLGYPVHMALVKKHFICQWVEKCGRRWNLEVSCPGGAEHFPDEHFHKEPHGGLSDKAMATGKYLRAMTADEERAAFLEFRGHCLFDNGKFVEAEAAYGEAVRCAPGWIDPAVHQERVEACWRYRRRPLTVWSGHFQKEWRFA